MRSIRRCTVFLSSFMLGIPYLGEAEAASEKLRGRDGGVRGAAAAAAAAAHVSSPPAFGARSKTVTSWPYFRLSSSAAASPAGPDPITATRFPEYVVGGRGTTHPSAHALSMIEYSMFLIVTASSTRPATHEPSHGAGQTRPVNSGKLFVDDRFVYACFHVSSNTIWLNSGIRLLIGQPVFVWQKGVPQSMQRADCRFSSPGSCCALISP